MPHEVKSSLYSLILNIATKSNIEHPMNLTFGELRRVVAVTKVIPFVLS